MTAGIVIHFVITAVENVPDSKVSIGVRLPVMKKIPQWKFFAPNPGVEDMHLMYRTKALPAQPWSAWAEIPLHERKTAFSMIWNPGSRSVKALFDAAQQIRVLAGYGSSFEWVVSSDGFQLLSDFVRQACRRAGTEGYFQFMLVAAVPRLGRDGLKPILVSPASEISDE